MYKRKITACIILLLLAAALTGFMFYASYVKDQQQVKKGTLVSAYSEVRSVSGL